jgi:hypothetical protein
MHGHSPGNMIEGTLTDTSGKSLSGKLILQDTLNCRTGPETVTETSTDNRRHWVIRPPTPSTYHLGK